MGVAGCGKVERNDNCKTKCDRNVTSDEHVDICETNMTIQSYAQLDDTLPMDYEPLEIAEKMDTEVQAIIITPQDTDDADDPADKIRG